MESPLALKSSRMARPPSGVSFSSSMPSTPGTPPSTSTPSPVRAFYLHRSASSSTSTLGLRPNTPRQASREDLSFYCVRGGSPALSVGNVESPLGSLKVKGKAKGDFFGSDWDEGDDEGDDGGGGGSGVED